MVVSLESCIFLIDWSINKKSARLCGADFTARQNTFRLEQSIAAHGISATVRDRQIGGSHDRIDRRMG
ncbi:MAG: hypothetical protein RIF44_10975, partial [Nitratireductor sp.]